MELIDRLIEEYSGYVEMFKNYDAGLKKFVPDYYGELAKHELILTALKEKKEREL
ncbi:MAG: hypothetical protein M0P47_12655 [Bacteroidales bacterium]|nr:hypothetical protein [Bacteroidales bacterium]